MSHLLTTLFMYVMLQETGVNSYYQDNFFVNSLIKARSARSRHSGVGVYVVNYQYQGRVRTFYKVRYISYL